MTESLKKINNEGKFIFGQPFANTNKTNLTGNVAVAYILQ